MSNRVRHYGYLRWAAFPAWLFGLVQLEAAAAVLRSPEPLTEYTTVPLLWVGLLNLTWAILFLLVGFLWITRQRNAPIYSAWLVLAFLGINLARHWIFTEADYERGRLTFLTITSAIIAIIPITYLVYCARQRGQSHGES